MADIFLSYANQDRERVVPVVQALEKQGWSVWWDRRIRAGKSFDEIIEKAISQARCVVVVWTKESVVSRWVKTEAAEGAERNILIPILLDDVKAPFEFRRIHAAQLINWRGDIEDDAFISLLDSLTEILGNSPDLSLEKVRGQEADQPGAEAGTSSVNDSVVAKQNKVIDEPFDTPGDSSTSESQEQGPNPPLTEPFKPPPDVVGASTAASDTERQMPGELSPPGRTRPDVLSSVRKRLIPRFILASVFLLLVVGILLFYLLRRNPPATILDRSGDPSRALALNRQDAEGNITRIYPSDTTVSHLLGEEEHGKSGLERALVAGYTKDVRLTIDSELQKEAANQLKGKAGAVVILNPQTGEILTMYSSPSYSLKEIQDEARRAQLNENEPDTPLVNRAMNAYYIPAHTFMTMLMIAAHRAGLQDSEFLCSGGGYYAMPGARPIFDDGGPGEVHGLIGIDRAYEVSCNQYFAQMAVKLGPEKIKETARLLGVGAYDTPKQMTYGRRSPEIWNASSDAIKQALAPREAMMAAGPLGEKFDKFDLAVEGYGQGYAGQMTPFQLALFAAVIGNSEGKLMKPKIEYDRPPEVFNQVLVPQAAARLREIMGRVTQGSEGTARGVFGPVKAAGITSGGKTGSAYLTYITVYDPVAGKPKTFIRSLLKYDKGQGGDIIRGYELADPSEEADPSDDQRIDSLFLCIAPLDDPRIAMVVVVEGGGLGSRSAAPIAAALVLKAKELKLF